jgi:hypothetical protein
MTTLLYGDLFKDNPPTLSVPPQTELMTVREAAIAWAKNGFYVLPIKPSSKHAGSVVGLGWPEKSSRNQDQIEKWFSTEPSHGIAIHLGKSGAIAFDVDDPAQLPHRLREWVMLENVPFQSTRKQEAMRGHYLFSIPQGSNYGNSKGGLRGAWGEVRGKNGIIVVSPSLHIKYDKGGQYVWKRTGAVPLLPLALQRLLPESKYQSVQAVDTAEADTFFSRYTSDDCRQLLEVRLADGKAFFSRGSRHDACRNLLLICMKDARAGLYDAKTSVESIATLFVSVKPQDEWSSPREFIEMTLWAIAQVLQFTDEEICVHRESQLTINSPQVQNWIRNND